MATVPKTNLTQATAIGQQRTTLPGITQFRGADASAKALQGLGDAVLAGSDDLAQVGARIQLGDEKRSRDAHDLRLKRIHLDHKIGNAEKGIEGYEQFKGEAALGKTKQIQDSLAKSVEAELSTIETQWVADELKAKNEIYNLQTDNSQGTYNIDQRNVARTDNSNAAIAHHKQALLTVPIGDKDAELQEVMALSIEAGNKARNDGALSQEAIDEEVQKAVGPAHALRVQHLLDQNAFDAADEYFKTYKVQMTAERQAKTSRAMKVAKEGQVSELAVKAKDMVDVLEAGGNVPVDDQLSMFSSLEGSGG